MGGEKKSVWLFDGSTVRRFGMMLSAGTDACGKYSSPAASTVRLRQVQFACGGYSSPAAGTGRQFGGSTVRRFGRLIEAEGRC